MEELVAEICASLHRIEDQLSASNGLGFCSSPRPRYIYCNRSNNCLWYWLNESREVVPIAEVALKGQIEKLGFKQVERRGKESWKMHLHVRADRLYILEAGFDSNFAKSMISALAIMHPWQISQPCTIEVQAADSEEVLFGRIYSGSEQVFAPWDDLTDWKALSRRAIESVAASTSRHAVVEATPVD